MLLFVPHHTYIRVIEVRKRGKLFVLLFFFNDGLICLLCKVVWFFFFFLWCELLHFFGYARKVNSSLGIFYFQVRLLYVEFCFFPPFFLFIFGFWVLWGERKIEVFLKLILHFFIIFLFIWLCYFQVDFLNLHTEFWKSHPCDYFFTLLLKLH